MSHNNKVGKIDKQEKSDDDEYDHKIDDNDNETNNINDNDSCNRYKTPTGRKPQRKQRKKSPTIAFRDIWFPFPKKLDFYDQNDIDMEKLAVGPCPKCKPLWKKCSYLERAADLTLEDIKNDIANVSKTFF